MSAVLQVGIAVAVSVVVGSGGTAYTLLVWRRWDETAAGLRMLATMSWRDFTRLVMDIMANRGFFRTDDTATDDGRHTLVRGSERLTLWCKHGSAFLIGKLTVNELAAEMRLADTPTGVLATQGRIVEDARDAAKERRIELLDGPAFWSEARTRVPASVLASIRTACARRVRSRVLTAWLLAAFAGIGSHAALGRLLPAEPAATADIATLADITTARAVTPERQSDATQATPDGIDTAPAEAEAPLRTDSPPPGPAAATSLSPAGQRDAAARDVADLPMVGRVEWTSTSTLRIELANTDVDAFEHICPLVERYPDIATSRIQLDLPADSAVPVRFRQCRTF